MRIGKFISAILWGPNLDESDRFLFASKKEEKEILRREEEARKQRATEDEHQYICDWVTRLGYNTGLRGENINYEKLCIALKRRFPTIEPSEYEIVFVAGHESGTARRQYALQHGASRPPSTIKGDLVGGISI